MSGIAGIVYPDNFPVGTLISPMLETMSHRGSGIKSVHTYRKMQVGICGGKLVSSDNGVIAALDGTLFNAKELIGDLTKQGYHFKDESCAEILTYAYDLWGPAFLEHLEGDFALFVLDQKNELLLIARDRMGKKPLYWFTNDHYFIFASELKALLATGAIPQTIAPDAIATYLYFGYLPQDMTPIKDVNKLLPSYYLIFNKNRSQKIQNYWSYSACFKQQQTSNPTSVIKDVDRLLEDSVYQRLPKKKPLGCLIAGGLGSASIAYYLRRLLPPEQIRAFTIEFQKENSQDTSAAQEFAKDLQLPHQCDVITQQNFLDDLVKIAWHLDEPISDPNVIATWRLAKAAQPVGTLFSGMGSDELLAGHSRYTVAEAHATYFNRLIQSGMPFAKSFILPILQLFSNSATYTILKQARTNPWQLDFLQQNALFKSDVRYSAAPDIAHLFDPIVFLHKFHQLPKIASNVASFLYLDVKTRLADCYMLQYDRLMSAHGVEWRTPFLSEGLVTYLAGLSEPDQLEENEAFCILKALLKNAFPKDCLNRPKKTRKHFLEPWAENVELRELFQMLSRGTLVETGLISRKWLQASLSSSSKRKKNFRYLWSLLALEIWFHLFINHPIKSRPPEMSVRDLLTGE